MRIAFTQQRLPNSDFIATTCHCSMKLPRDLAIRFPLSANADVHLVVERRQL